MSPGTLWSAPQTHVSVGAHKVLLQLHTHHAPTCFKYTLLPDPFGPVIKFRPLFDFGSNCKHAAHTSSTEPCSQGELHAVAKAFGYHASPYQCVVGLMANSV